MYPHALANLMDVRVINLERRPDRKMRMMPLIDNLKSKGFDASFVQAVDGRTLTTYEQDRICKRDRTTRRLKKTEIGVNMSHQQSWSGMTKEMRLIFEDDAVMTHNISMWLNVLYNAIQELYSITERKGFDILFCHTQMEKVNQNRLFYDSIGSDVDRWFSDDSDINVDIPAGEYVSHAGPRFGALCYVITKEGSRYLLDIPMRTCIDVHLHLPFVKRTGRMFVMRRPIVIPRDITDSDSNEPDMESVKQLSICTVQ